MISASHNPYYDNGIKLINGNGSCTLTISNHYNFIREIDYMKKAIITCSNSTIELYEFVEAFYLVSQKANTALELLRQGLLYRTVNKENVEEICETSWNRKKNNTAYVSAFICNILNRRGSGY